MHSIAKLLKTQDDSLKNREEKDSLLLKANCKTNFSHLNRNYGKRKWNNIFTAERKNAVKDVTNALTYTSNGFVVHHLILTTCMGSLKPLTTPSYLASYLFNII